MTIGDSIAEPLHVFRPELNRAGPRGSRRAQMMDRAGLSTRR